MKYKLTGESRDICARALYRIQALRDGPWGPVGTLGGWIERESNLAQDGECWVGGEALVWGGTRVSGDSWVYGEEWVPEEELVSKMVPVVGDVRIGGGEHFGEEDR